MGVCGHFWVVWSSPVSACGRWAPLVGGADWLSSFLGGGSHFRGLFWVVEADRGGGVVIDGSRVLVGLVAWHSHVVVVLVGVGCERTAGSLVAVGSGGDVVALLTMVVVVVGRQTMCIVCLLFVVPNRTLVFAENRPRPYRLIIID